VNWGLRGCFLLDFRPLCWAASRALRGLKTGGNLPGAAPPKFPSIVSRGVFSTPCPIWRPQQPPAAQRNGPFFSRGCPCGARRAPAPLPASLRDAPPHAPGRTCLGSFLQSPGAPAANSELGPHSLSTLGNEARTEESPVRRLQKEEEEVPPDHMIEELPGEESKYEEEKAKPSGKRIRTRTSAEWTDLHGDLGAGIRDRSTGSRRGLKKTERVPPQPRAKRSSSSECSCSSVFSTPCPIWRPQQPPTAQRNGPFFSRGAESRPPPARTPPEKGGSTDRNPFN
jgi:hypothetical protein